MLDEVLVSNLGLIAEASISPAKGLTVVTGETGAGKTVMLGALRLLSGEPAGKGLIGPHGEEADVSARFVDAHDHVARRVVGRNRSKAYLDGAISTAGALKETIGTKVAIVGQHDQHTITSSAGVRKLVDGSLTRSETETLRTYDEVWARYENLLAEAELLGPDQRHLARELETVRFQIAEINEAGFSVGDEQVLRSKANKLRNAAELATSIDDVLGHLGDTGAVASLSEAARALDAAARIDPALEDLASQVHDVLTALSDISAETVGYASDLDVDPSNLHETEERVALLSSLKRKYGDSLEAIISFGLDAGLREEELANLLVSASDIAERLQTTRSAVAEAGDSLRKARQKAADRIAITALEHLSDLGFEKPIVEIAIEPADPTRSGADTATVRFASDDALSPGPISAIASGGELSRLVLALTLASGGIDTDIVAFDEIDAGVGGETALAMGRKLAALAEARQVICVTHLPQIAAFADKHFLVQRSGTSTTIEEVAGSGRTEELSRMLAGLSSSVKGREHARELLELAGNIEAH